MGAHLSGTRPVHDPRSGLLLRRDGPAPQRPEHADDEVLVPARRPAGVGDGRSSRWLTAGTGRSSATSTGRSSTG